MGKVRRVRVYLSQSEEPSDAVVGLISSDGIVLKRVVLFYFFHISFIATFDFPK